MLLPLPIPCHPEHLPCAGHRARHSLCPQGLPSPLEKAEAKTSGRLQADGRDTVPAYKDPLRLGGTEACPPGTAALTSGQMLHCAHAIGGPVGAAQRCPLDRECACPGDFSDEEGIGPCLGSPQFHGETQLLHSGSPWSDGRDKLLHSGYLSI